MLNPRSVTKSLEILGVSYFLDMFLDFKTTKDVQTSLKPTVLSPYEAITRPKWGIVIVC